MKFLKFFSLFSLACLSFFAISCGGGGGGTTSDTGTVTMSITDAKPMLPDEVERFFVEFTEVWVHKPGEGWIQLELVESPYAIDLLQFHDGTTTELVPPTSLTSGKYTQVRFVLNNAWLEISNGGETETVPVEIPSEFLRTDKNFTIDVDPSSAIDLVAHFDLSTSLVVSGTDSDPEYKLKPVLHLFGDPLEAAEIDGSIDDVSLGDSGQATITVISNEEIFTQVVVPEIAESETSDSSTSSIPFSIFWLVPDKSYTVEIDLDQDGTADCTQTVEDADLMEGELFHLNGDQPIKMGEGICAH